MAVRLQALILGLVLLAPVGARAHAVLLETVPAHGTRLEVPPEVIRLRFSEPVRPTRIQLLDGRGQAVEELAVAAEEETVLVQPAVPLARGAYLLSYRVTSLDGHPVGAALRFGVGVDPGETAAEPVDAIVPWLGVAARWLVYAAVLGVVGQTLFLAGVRPPDALAIATGRLRLRFAVAAILILPLSLGLRGLELAGLPLAALATTAPWAAALHSSLGPAAAFMLAGTLVQLARPALMGIVGAGIVAAAFALSGHAATAEPAWLGRPAIALHVAAAAFWLGSLAPLLMALRLPAEQAQRVVRRFSRMAGAAVTIVLIGGVILACIQLGGRAGALLDTAYGLRLALKLGLVGGLLLLAAVNRFIITPALGREDEGGRRWLGRSLLADVALKLGVLAVTASLPLDPPPRTLAASVTLSGRGGGAMVTLFPGRIGVNRLEIVARTSDGAMLAAKEAGVEVGLPDAGIEAQRVVAVMDTPGVYHATGLALPRSGRWAVRLDLLVDDFTRLAFRGEIVVP